MRGYNDLQDWMAAMERAGELVRVKAEVDPILEITEITDRESKKPGGGKALLFENVKGSKIPLLINAYGSYERMALAMGVKSFSEVGTMVGRLLKEEVLHQGWGEKLKLAGELAKAAMVFPKTVGSGACQEVVLTGDAVDLGLLPILQCWPHDAGRFITFPSVITRDPETGTRNVGMYRMQVFDKKTTGMHWQTQKDSAIHSAKSRMRSKRLEVAVVIGADPSVTFAGIVPLPFGVDEFMLAGFLRGKRLDLVKCKTIDLEVPANAEIVLEGYVDPEDMREEGPFGDHTGVYTPVELFPAFHVTAITMKKNPVYISTIVGKPPMEDLYMGKAVEQIFLPVLKKQIPELVDMNFLMEGTFNNAVIVSIDKQYPFQARKVAHAIWGLGQLSYTKVVIVVDKTVNVHDVSAVTLAVFNNIDPKRDCFFVEGPVDTLNHAAPVRDFGSKMGIDATAKWKEEGYTRVWPEEIQMDDATKAKVTARAAEYGIPGAK